MDALPPILSELLARYKPKVLFAKKAEEETGNVGIYDEEGYANMTTDLRRNKVYMSAIEQAAEAGAKVFLEIGPGADACLTSMVCQSKQRVLAIEGNPASAAKAAATLGKRK